MYTCSCAVQSMCVIDGRMTRCTKSNICRSLPWVASTAVFFRLQTYDFLYLFMCTHARTNAHTCATGNQCILLRTCARMWTRTCSETVAHVTSVMVVYAGVLSR